MLPSIFFIVNPKSCSGKTAKLWEKKILPKVLSVFPKANWVFTNSQGAGSYYALYAKQFGYEIVVAVGGDGTINEVVNGLLGNVLNAELFVDHAVEVHGIKAPFTPKQNPQETLLACLPLGTGCDFIKSLGIPKNIKKSLHVILAKRTLHCDVGLIEFQQVQANYHRYFINIGGCGANGETIQTLSSFRNKFFGRRSLFLFAAIKTLLRNKSFTVEISYDDQQFIPYNLTVLFVCNGKYCGGGMKVSPSASLQNGKFNVVQVNKMNYLKTIFMLYRLYTGNYKGLEYAITEKKVSSISIRPVGAAAVPAECDGELPGDIPAKFSIYSQKLRVIVK